MRNILKVANEKELAEAVKNNEEKIEIEGDLARKTIKIKATGKIAWLVAIGAIGVAVIAILSAPATAGGGALVSGAVAPAAVGILGFSTTATAISIAIAGGGVAVLNKLRGYSLEKISDDKVVLTKK